VSAQTPGRAARGKRAPESSRNAAAPRTERDRAIRPAVALRPATAEDCRAVWLWRNDEETRRASLDSSFIEYGAHQRWFLESLERTERKIYIVLEGGEPCGVVRLDVTAQQATVSIFLDRRRQGHGIGPSALDAVADVAERDMHLTCLLARIKPDNHRSLAAFKRAGFTPSLTTAAVTMARVLDRSARRMRSASVAPDDQPQSRSR
jgi:RimJ/RimL family protein N-acetyltransferase